MTETIINPLLSQPRIVNLSKIGLHGDNLLPITHKEDSAGIIATVRQYSDVPQVYVVDQDRRGLVSEILTSLHAIRSTCYPHALFVVSGDYSEFSGPYLDIVALESAAATDIIDQINRYARQQFSFDKSANNIPGNLYNVKFFKEFGNMGWALGSNGLLLKYTG